MRREQIDQRKRPGRRQRPEIPRSILVTRPSWEAKQLIQER